MATEAQIKANRANSRKSTGPRTTEGKAKSSQNAVEFGLFTTNNCVMPEDREFYDRFCAEIWRELAPANVVEELNAAEFIRAAWRLRRCALSEEKLGKRAEELPALRARFSGIEEPAKDPMLESDTSGWQRSIDRARGQAHAAFRRAQADLARLRKEREIQNEANCDAVASESVEQNEANSGPEIVPEVQAEVPEHAEQNEPNSTPKPASVGEPEAAGSVEQNEPNSDTPETKRTQFGSPLRFAA